MGSVSPSAESLIVYRLSTDTQIKDLPPHPKQFKDRARKVGKEYSLAVDGMEMSPKNSVSAP